MRAAWVDGQPALDIGVGNRGLAYGDGLFETLAVVGGQVLLLQRHLQRLGLGSERLGIAIDIAVIERELRHAAGELLDGVLKLVVTRGDAARGYLADPLAPARRILLANPPVVYPPGHAEQGVRLFPCRVRLAQQPLLAGLKHLNRLEQVLARNEWQDPAFAEGLMLDTDGHVIEGVYSNFFFVRDDVLCTAQLNRCGVAGVMREELLAQAQQMGWAVRVADFSLTDLAQASEAFMCNSVYGLWPVREYAALSWPVGPRTRTLQGIARRLWMSDSC